MSTIKLEDGREVDEQLYRERFEHASNKNRYERQVPCKFCLRPSSATDRTCAGCLEVTSRFEGFLQEGGLEAYAFIMKAMAHWGRRG